MISGLTEFPGFITKEEEENLIQHMKKVFQEEGSNFIKYGFIRSPKPEWLMPVWTKLNDELSFDANRVNMNRFHPGELLMDAHVDYWKADQGGGESITLGVLSDCYMTIWDGDEMVQKIFRPSKHAIKFAGDAFWKYKHRVEPTKSMRYSIVLFSTINIGE